MVNQIHNDYKNWLIGLACDWCSHYGSYAKLMDCLYSLEFIALYPNDRNRCQDGIEMRFRFAEVFGQGIYTYHDVYNYLINNHCSVLEMMIALARRCEDHIMGDPDIGDRSGVWFFEMVRTLHLDQMTDENFDISYVEQVVKNLIEHNYARNGDGGLFSVRNQEIDMPRAEIWHQLNWHLGELYNQY